MSKKDNIPNLHRTKIGGQALIEGIMMRGVGKAAMAVRQKDGSIYLEEWAIPAGKWYQKIPFVRGSFNFLIQMIDGYKYISKSAEKSGMMEDESEEEPSKFEAWLDRKFGDKLTNAIMVVAMVLGIALAVVLFLFVPTWIFTGIQTLCGDSIAPFRSLFEGILKIALFVGYLALTSTMKDIKRMYQYHGAEHKTIAAYEAGDELIPERIRLYKRFHPRCGTSFIFLVLAISILVYSIVPVNSEMFIAWFGVSSFVADLLRVVAKIVLLPVIVGISYEVIRIAGRYDNIVTRIISAPGLCLQRLTTKEPDDSMMEIAAAAMNAVIPEDKESDKW